MDTMKYFQNEAFRLPSNDRSRLVSQQGMVLVPLLAVVSVALFGFMALAIDVGNLVVVKAELQRAADIAAMTAAQKLYPVEKGQFNSLAKTLAENTITSNLAGSKNLTKGDIDVSTGTGLWTSTNGFQTATAPDATSAGAFKVTVERGKDNPLLASWFARLVGFTEFHPKATATYVQPTGIKQVNAPGGTNTVKRNGLFPMAVKDTVFGNVNWWDYATKSSAASSPGFNVPIEKKCDNKTLPSCDNFAWTCFSNVKDCSAADLKALVETGKNKAGEGPSLAVNGQTYLFPGVAASILDSVDTCLKSTDPKTRCEYVLVPVVDSTDMNGKTNVNVTSFACVRITNVDKKDKFVGLNLVGLGNPNCNFSTVVPDTGNPGGRTSYGVMLEPMLAE